MEIRTAARLDEMSQNVMSLRLELFGNDIAVFIEKDGSPIQDEDGTKARVEFCCIAAGGGRSPRTLRALAALFVALKEDAREDPSGIPKYPVGLAEAMANDR